eukprot:COSAG03_NODE_5470_length_1243_cov_1.356643_1_plen_31_part_10
MIVMAMASNRIYDRLGQNLHSKYRCLRNDLR